VTSVDLQVKLKEPRYRARTEEDCPKIKWKLPGVLPDLFIKRGSFCQESRSRGEKKRETRNLINRQGLRGGIYQKKRQIINNRTLLAAQ